MLFAMGLCAVWVFFFQAEDGIRDAQESRGLGDVYKRQVEASYLVATADGVFDDAEKNAFRTIVLEACRGAVASDSLEALLADLADQLEEDGLDHRVQMVSKTINRTDQQREVLRIATFLAFASGGVSDAELDVIEKMSRAFEIDDAAMQSVLKEVKQAIDEAPG